MKFLLCRVPRSISSVLVIGFLVLCASCGPEDYQKPIQDFQNAVNTVIAADRGFLGNENNIEQNLYIDQQVFEQKPLGPADLNARIIITPAEIKFRTDALDALSRYTTNLATLAQGKSDSSTGQNMKSSSANLQTSASKADSDVSSKKNQSDFNKKFSGIATTAATAIGAVAQLIMEHKARNEIRKSVKATDKDITALISLIGDDAQGSYLRQQSQSDAYGMQLYNDYKGEIAVGLSSPPDTDTDKHEPKCPKKVKGCQPDPVLLLSLADRLKSFRTQQTTLENANPAPAIAQMQKAHEALVEYVSSDKNPEKLSDLVTEVKNFVAAAQPLGQAVQSLMTPTK